jgi:hypothetical protein
MSTSSSPRVPLRTGSSYFLPSNSRTALSGNGAGYLGMTELLLLERSGELSFI